MPKTLTAGTLDEAGVINVSLDEKFTDLPSPLDVVPNEVHTETLADCPPLNIVIFIVGSQGDVQPYIALALALVISYSHRVRIATHPEFKQLILSANKRLEGLHGKFDVALQGRIEFFDVGGDPRDLMAFMVKNPGLVPGTDSLLRGETLKGFYRSCFFPDQLTNVPFAADAIISNPPAFAHVHVAEAFGLPLLLSFTMPWTATTAFSHPLLAINGDSSAKMKNFLSYAVVDQMVWQGLGDVINSFRRDIGLDDLSMRTGPSVTERLKVPWTYCWSEGLIPKPEGWRRNIDISGFYFLEDAGGFVPDKALTTFLATGEPPVYIGFGSIVLDDPDGLTDVIVKAVQSAGVRALISAGWSGLGKGSLPESIHVLSGGIPHDWLFSNHRVSLVCHHGGAGTTAIGLRNGLPSIVVPFFGDQRFWGDMIHQAGAGPQPLPRKLLTAQTLTSAIEMCLLPDTRLAAEKLGQTIRSEDGVRLGVASFQRHLPPMRCDLDAERVAVWWMPKQFLQLSAGAAAVLVDAQIVQWDVLEPLRTRRYDSTRQISDPVTGTAAAVYTLVMNYIQSFPLMITEPTRGIQSNVMSIPAGMCDIVQSVWEGLDNAPRLVGSKVRSQGRVMDFGSGIKEAGKGFAYGIWDGVSGLITDPVRGAETEGARGVAKGVGRSLLGLITKPATGTLGLVVLPCQGAYRGLTFTNKMDPLRQSRRDQSLADFRNFSHQGKNLILQQYHLSSSKEAMRTRRKTWKRERL